MLFLGGPNLDYAAPLTVPATHSHGKVNLTNQRGRPSRRLTITVTGEISVGSGRRLAQCESWLLEAVICSNSAKPTAKTREL